MKTRKRKQAYVEVSEECYSGLQEIAQNSPLKLEKVASLILRCEMKIIRYSTRKRKKLARRLKIGSTQELLRGPLREK